MTDELLPPDPLREAVLLDDPERDQARGDTTLADLDLDPDQTVETEDP
jgi:hypothetical protein